jgi:hypothetical protein
MFPIQTTLSLSAANQAAVIAKRPRWMLAKPTPTLIELALRLEAAERQITELRNELDARKEN